MEEIKTPEGGTVIKIPIEDEVKQAYIDYSMSVIVQRALPDVRDGSPSYYVFDGYFTSCSWWKNKKMCHNRW